MRTPTRFLAAALALLLCCALPAQAGMLSKVKNKAKSTANKVEDKAEDAGDAAKNTAKKVNKKTGATDKVKRADQQAKSEADQVGGVFKEIF